MKSSVTIIPGEIVMRDKIALCIEDLPTKDVSDANVYICISIDDYKYLIYINIPILSI